MESQMLELRALVALGRNQGFLTYDQVSEYLPDEASSAEKLDELLVALERVGVEIFKDPKTDSGMKKSAKGLTAVYEQDGEFILKDQATWDEVKNCALKCVFKNGKIMKEYTLSEIRNIVSKNF